MEDPVPYGTPSYLETVQSQLPALQLLTAMGWDYLSPAECVNLRNGRLGTALLDSILVDFVREHGRYQFKGSEHPFTENAIANAAQALKAFRASGAVHQNEEVYDLLCLGTSVPQTIEGDTKSFSIHYIDWKHPENNRYHCTAEYRLERIGLQKHYVPDIVLFINGIPVAVMECKRDAYADRRQNPLDRAISQLAAYQQKDGIPQLFLSCQLLLALTRNGAEYGTTGTPRKFWSQWREPGLEEAVRELISKPLPNDSPLMAQPFEGCAEEFSRLHREGRESTTQDQALYALCRPERFLALAYRAIIFDNGIKKIARYQQYFAVEDILRRLRGGDPERPRAGGVVWHTQGSGKSLTMVMLAKALVLAPDIHTPKVILVTDRIDLDDQICGTFRACGFEPEQANTGRDLVRLLSDDKAHVVTTLIHKFETATKSRDLKQAPRNTFVLVDEGHRTNYSEHHARMKLALKGACFIAFTGTPLAKNVKKTTFDQFGPLYKPPYTIAKAVEDKAVTPLLYEARHVPQTVDQNAIDSWFEKLTRGLNEAQRADLKRKFSSEQQLNKAEQKVRMIAWDVGQHYCGTYQGTGMKGQLVAPDKATARLYKQYLDEFDQLSSEVLVSGPNEFEGEDKKGRSVKKEISPEERAFWSGMMDRYGSETKYNKLLINAFKKGSSPEIIIVVDKLLTGFDAPCNTVLYLARRLRNHTLLQAIARVNRLFDGKEYGLILDYSGDIADLDEAIEFYQKLADFDESDLEQTVHFVNGEIAKLPQRHSDVWELFPGLKGSADPEPFAQCLRKEEQRNRFYERFALFARTLALALSSESFLEDTKPKAVVAYKQDLKFFQGLRAEVAFRFQERIDFSEYEPKIQKLINTHVSAADVVPLCDPINLFDAKERQAVLEEQGRSSEAKADMIASATQRTIELEMEKDPSFYKKFSKMIEEVLDAIYNGRVSAMEALPKLKDLANRVATHTDESLPDVLVGQDMARRYYGVVREEVESYTTEPSLAVRIAVEIQKRLGEHRIRDFRDNPDALNRMRNEIDDIFFDVTEEMGVKIPLKLQDMMIDRCIEITIANDD